jgi:serum/glucocorticoid-regulated kinase 2
LDYYCLGALLFEMMTGLPPYYSKDTNEMYNRILHEELNFSEANISNPLIIDLLKKLLAKDPK